MKLNRALTSFVPVAAIVLTGCATAPMAIPEKDITAKAFLAVPEKAIVYVYRDENFGGAVKVPIVVNNRLIGDTVAHSYFRLQLDPGPCEVLCKAEIDSRVTFQVEAGKLYFVRQEMKMGMWAAGCSMHLMDDGEGRNAVLKCKLLEASESLPK